MYFFQLKIENEILQYENYLYKLSIQKRYHHQKPRSSAQKRKINKPLFPRIGFLSATALAHSFDFN